MIIKTKPVEDPKEGDVREKWEFFFWLRVSPTRLLICEKVKMKQVFEWCWDTGYSGNYYWVSKEILEY